MSFSNKEYVHNYNMFKQYPKIHDRIVNLIKNCEILELGDTILDLGACTGLISAQLIDFYQLEKAIAVEGNLNYFRSFVRNNKIEPCAFYINRQTLPLLNQIIMKFQTIRLCVARRVFPEISKRHDIEMVRETVKVLSERDIKYLAIEGRIRNRKSKMSLWNVELEAEAVKEFYLPIKKQGDAWMLQKI